MKLINNGYYVRGLIQAGMPPALERYGAGNYMPWLLDFYLDNESNALEWEAFDR